MKINTKFNIGDTVYIKEYFLNDQVDGVFISGTIISFTVRQDKMEYEIKVDDGNYSYYHEDEDHIFKTIDEAKDFYTTDKFNKLTEAIEALNAGISKDPDITSDRITKFKVIEKLASQLGVHLQISYMYNDKPVIDNVVKYKSALNKEI